MSSPNGNMFKVLKPSARNTPRRATPKNTFDEAALLPNALEQLVRQHLREWPRLRLHEMNRVLEYTSCRICIFRAGIASKKQCAAQRVGAAVSAVRAQEVQEVRAVVRPSQKDVIMEGNKAGMDGKGQKVKDEEAEKLASLIEELRLAEKEDEEMRDAC
ncbi:hypothetical protein RUND412_001974 [Rhizina undulata]